MPPRQDGPAGPLPPATAAFAGILGMALVAWALGMPQDDPDVRRSHLYNRYRVAGGWRWAVRLRQAGIETVCLKGLAAAAALYPEPELRAMADADLLVRPADLSHALRYLLSQGFAVGQEPTRHPWGFIGDASAEPLISPEGGNLDLHRHPDAWPLHGGLSTEEVLAGSLEVETPEGRVRVPRPEHQLLIAASNAARDLFDPPSLKLLIDGALLLRAGRRPGMPATGLDWAEIEQLARGGDSLRALRTYLSLIVLLGFDGTGIPQRLMLAPSGPASWLLDRVATDLAAGHFGDPAQDHGLGHKLMREMLLSASGKTVLWRNSRRLAGLVRPNRGMLGEAR
ncbi:MAG: nucleotidyltransferase family protein [Sneathiellaceae bacterium]